MFAEHSQLQDHARQDHASTAAHLARLMRQANSGIAFQHPILDWSSSNPSDAPALHFDLGRVEQRMHWLGERARSLGITALVSVKSCPDPEFLGVGHRHLGGFDVSNLTEYAGLPDDLEGKLVSIASPGMISDVDRFVAKGNSAVVVIDSQTQLDRYFQQKPSVPYVLRVQGSDLLKDMDPPDVAYYPETRFGFTVESINRLLQQPLVRTNPPRGLHVHHGSEENRVSTYRALIDGLKYLARQLPVAPECINLGGGWHRLSDDEFGLVLTEARQAFPLPCSILIEPGRWYAEDAGFAVCTIVNRLQPGDTAKYVVNLSSRCHLRWSDVKLIFPLEPGFRRLHEVELFGPSCYEGDRIGRFLLPYRDDFLAESGFVPGKRIVFSGVSTYSAAWNTSFNGIPKADVTWRMWQ